ncbi:L,D-transpeptidase family protein [Bosea sp. Root670]|uniref:L,D-transpeptidase family protein n=1 Tax=Bosea sp. Root670 TaxID=1736583 RepID=UPI0009E77463|nr:L,D-transpeptidase [Bosea sp. Root670]
MLRPISTYRIVRAAVAVVAVLAVAGNARALTADEINRADMPTSSTARKAKPAAALVKMQTLLARQGISPGEIDGMDGENYRKAIAQYRRRENLGSGDVVDEATWRALGGDRSQDIVISYSVAKADARYVFSKRIPRDYARQARMRRLAYSSAPEMFAERFRMGKGLFRALNPRADYRVAGTALQVIAADRAAPGAEATLIKADKRTGIVAAYGSQGEMIASYPATIGSSDTPSPEGEYQVARIVRQPTYHYDPVKNFQQGRNTRRLVLPRGPNNPVGSIWIGLSKPTFGIHGTPEPSRIGKASSHGCVRLTNWDAEDLARMVKPGTVVRFTE